MAKSVFSNIIFNIRGGKTTMINKYLIFIQSIFFLILFTFIGMLFIDMDDGSFIMFFLMNCFMSLILGIVLFLRQEIAIWYSDLNNKMIQSKYIIELSKLGIDIGLTWTDYSISPDAASYLARQIIIRKPDVIVECGSGDSTIIMAKLMALLDYGGKVYSLEHDKKWAEQTTEMVTSIGLGAHSEVIHAPLKNYKFDNQYWDWYSGFKDKLPKKNIDLLFIDGPSPQNHDNRAPRYPAVPYFIDQLNTESIIILDDAIRDAELEYIQIWKDRYSITGEIKNDFARGLALLKINKQKDIT